MPHEAYLTGFHSYQILTGVFPTFDDIESAESGPTEPVARTPDLETPHKSKHAVTADPRLLEHTISTVDRAAVASVMPRPSIATLQPSDTLAAMLAATRLERYMDVLDWEGYVEVEDLFDADDAELAAVGLKPAEIQRLRKALAHAAGRQHTRR